MRSCETALDSVRYGVKADQAYGFVSRMRTSRDGGAPASVEGVSVTGGLAKER